MAISTAQLLKELLPGLNALFGLEYAKYGEEHAEIFESDVIFDTSGCKPWIRIDD